MEFELTQKDLMELKNQKLIQKSAWQVMLGIDTSSEEFITFT
jgi:hypothetical protein